MLNIPPDRFEGDNEAFCDPWGNAYRVKLETPTEVEADSAFEGVISFPAQYRYFCEDGIYDEDFRWNDRLWEP